jgi:predicted Zn-dependent protease
MRRSVAPTVILSLAALALSCATTPTGRRQLRFLPESEMKQLGAASFAQLKKEMKPSSDPVANATARCVSQAIVQALSQKEGRSERWEVVVFDDPTPNAFALPGYKIGVHTGLMKVAQTPGQLAAVIGHEVGHVLAKHGNERLSQNVVAQSGLALAAIVTGATTQSDTKRQLILAAIGAGATVGVLLPYSRTHESEADEIGLGLMARAGFDPNEAVALWRNMQRASSGGQPPQFLSTHPSHERRIQALTQKVPQVRGLYQQAVASGRQAHCPHGA